MSGMPAKELLHFIKNSPTCYHVTENIRQKLLWSLDGQPIEGANSLVYGFKPSKIGEHTLTFPVKYDNQRTKASLTRNIAVSGVDEVSVNIPVKCCEAAGKRPFAAGNSIYSKMCIRDSAHHVHLYP